MLPRIQVVYFIIDTYGVVTSAALKSQALHSLLLALLAVLPQQSLHRIFLFK